jgi:hypothetical protein
MPAKKLAVWLEEELADQIVAAAEKDTAGNVSAWLAQAARERLRQAAARRLLEEHVAKHGPISEEERARVRREWPRD